MAITHTNRERVVKGNVVDLRAIVAAREALRQSASPRVKGEKEMLSEVQRQRTGVRVTATPEVKVRSRGKQFFFATIKTALYLFFVGSLVWGLPNFLSWKLGSAYPIAAITSGSMWPQLHRGDLVLIEGVQPKDIAVGDIVVWSGESGGFVIHRVVKLTAQSVVTKGDGNFKEDEPVSYDRVVGRAVTIGKKPFHIPYLGYVSIFGANIRSNFN